MFSKKRNWIRVSNSGLIINAKMRRKMTNLLYLFVLFTKIKKIWRSRAVENKDSSSSAQWGLLAGKDPDDRIYPLCVDWSY
jgi:hypothetical protein